MNSAPPTKNIIWNQIRTESMEDAIRWLDLSFGYRL